MKIIITGATGMIGRGVLLECLDSEIVKKVLIIGRNSIELKHPKLEELIHNDFTSYQTVKDQFKGYDACFFCLGISSQGLKRNEYKKITYDYTLELANVLYKINPELTFNYVSGQGTDTSEKSKMYWANIKGKTENDLLRVGFKQAFMFRPGFIIPLRDLKSRTKSYQFFYDYFTWLLKLIKMVMPNSIVNTTQIGRAMINSVINGYNKDILKPKDILILSK